MANISIKVEGIDAVIAKIKKVPGGIKPFMKAVSIYLLGDANHGLRHDDPYKFVTRAKAYGVVSSDGAPPGYFSWKQFRKVAALTKGFKDFKSFRPTESSPAWMASATMGGYGYKLSNSRKAMYYLRSDEGQTRHEKLVGWRKVSKVIADNLQGAIRSGMAAFRAHIG